MEIQEFLDGYCLTHKGVNYKYKEKSDDVIIMIAEKVKTLLLKDKEELKKKILSDNYLT